MSLSEMYTKVNPDLIACMIKTYNTHEINPINTIESIEESIFRKSRVMIKNLISIYYIKHQFHKFAQILNYTMHHSELSKMVNFTSHVVSLTRRSSSYVVTTHSTHKLVERCSK